MSFHELDCRYRERRLPRSEHSHHFLPFCLLLFLIFIFQLVVCTHNVFAIGKSNEGGKCGSSSFAAVAHPILDIHHFALNEMAGLAWLTKDPVGGVTTS
jgi:hypothetical protein